MRRQPSRAGATLGPRARIRRIIGEIHDATPASAYFRRQPAHQRTNRTRLFCNDVLAAAHGILKERAPSDGVTNLSGPSRPCRLTFCLRTRSRSIIIRIIFIISTRFFDLAFERIIVALTDSPSRPLPPNFAAELLRQFRDDRRTRSRTRVRCKHARVHVGTQVDRHERNERKPSREFREGSPTWHEDDAGRERVGFMKDAIKEGKGRARVQGDLYDQPNHRLPDPWRCGAL